MEAPCEYSRQFYSFAPGVLVADCAGVNEVSKMYYAMLGNELLSMRGDRKTFIGIHPIDALPVPSQGTAPCVVDQFYAPVFRIAGQSPLDIFCVAGFGIQGDEFKHIYDTNGYRGLAFEEVWAGDAGHSGANRR